jgi:hypothetical protein
MPMGMGMKAVLCQPCTEQECGPCSAIQEFRGVELFCTPTRIVFISRILTLTTTVARGPTVVIATITRKEMRRRATLVELLLNFGSKSFSTQTTPGVSYTFFHHFSPF